MAVGTNMDEDRIRKAAVKLNELNRVGDMMKINHLHKNC